MIRAQPSFEPSSAERAGSPARTPVEVAGWLLLAGLVLYLCVFSGLTTLGFVGPDEPRYASIARAMAASQDWVTPRLYGEPWLEKPILYYWAAGLAYRLGGETEWAARLPSALSAGLTSLAVAWLGWRLFGALTGAIAFVVFPTTVATFALARGATTDMLFSASLTVAMVAAAPRLLTNDRRRRWAAMFGVAVGFATLAKGPAGILLAVGSVMLWGVASGQTARLRALAGPLAVTCFALVSLPWYVFSILRTPEFVEVFLIGHNIDRFLTPVFRHQQPFWFFGPILVLGIAPWSAFLVATARRGYHSWRDGRWRASRALYVAAWVVFPCVFFSLSQSKLPGYIMPTIAPLAVVLAVTITQLLDRDDRSLRWVLFGTATVFASLTTAFALPGLLIADVPGLAANDIRPLAPIVGVASVAIAALAYLRRSHAAVAVVPLGFALAVGYLNTAVAPVLDPLISPRATARRVQELGDGNVEVYRLQRGWHYGLNYYLDREVAEWDERGSPSPTLVVTPSDAIDALTRPGFSVETVEHISTEAVLVKVRTIESTGGRSRKN